MKRKITLVLITLLNIFSYAQDSSNGFEFIDDYLLSETKVDSNDLAVYRNIYDKILVEIRNEIDTTDDIYDQQEDLFELFHESLMRKYYPKSILSDTFKKRTYNCVTAVILYKAIAIDLKLPLDIYESPMHVYCAFPNEDQREIILEFTSPRDGFDFNKNKEEYLSYLLEIKFITEHELMEKGEDKIYREYVANSKRITNNVLLSRYQRNIAIFASMEKDNNLAYQYIKAAMNNCCDSTNAEVYKYVWASKFNDELKNIDARNRLLLEMHLPYNLLSNFGENYYSEAGRCIFENLQNRNRDMVDSIYNKLSTLCDNDSCKYSGVLSDINEMIMQTDIQEAYLNGDYKKCYELSKTLFFSSGKKISTQEVYIKAGLTFIDNLIRKGEKSKALEEIKELYKIFPNLGLVTDTYANLLMQIISENQDDIELVKKTMEEVTEIMKNSERKDSFKRVLAFCYRELAMEKVRKKSYKNAIEFLKEGLKHCPNNEGLQKELVLIKEIIKK